MHRAPLVSRRPGCGCSGGCPSERPTKRSRQQGGCRDGTLVRDIGRQRVTECERSRLSSALPTRASRIGLRSRRRVATLGELEAAMRPPATANPAPISRSSADDWTCRPFSRSLIADRHDARVTLQPLKFGGSNCVQAQWTAVEAPRLSPRRRSFAVAVRQLVTVNSKPAPPARWATASLAAIVSLTVRWSSRGRQIRPRPRF